MALRNSSAGTMPSVARDGRRASGVLALPLERTDAVAAVLTDRLRILRQLAQTEVTGEELSTGAHVASPWNAEAKAPPFPMNAWESPMPPVVFPNGADPATEVALRLDEARSHIEQINTLRRELRHRQQAVRQVKGLFKAKKIRACTTLADETQRELDAARRRLGLVAHQGSVAISELRTSLRRQLVEATFALGQMDQWGASEADLPWELDRWRNWRALGCLNPAQIRVGVLCEDPSGNSLPVPLMAPLVGQGQSILLSSEGAAQHAQANALLQSLVLRTMAMFPRQARYTLLDPSGNGLAFPMARSLPGVSVGTGDVRRDLDEVTREIQRIVRTYLDPSRPTFEDIPDAMRLAENYHFVVVADYPNGYDLRSAEALQTIARTGPRAGVYVILHTNKDRDRPGDSEMDRYGLENSFVIDVGSTDVTVGDFSGSVVYDDVPSPSLQEQIFNRLKSVPPRDKPINWDELNQIPEVEWWQESGEQLITAPIGLFGANEPLQVWFGTDQWQQRPCVHGVLGAMPGAGKSTLFHNLITALAIRYSPDELRFHLIDGKFGVEFQPYVNLPHAAVVSLRTSPAMSRSVLADAVTEMSRRNAVFSRNGVVDLPGYRQRGQPEGNMARILLIVDEYQQLFDGDRDGEASANLLRLSQQGRSSGIHMLLASQRFDTAGMLHRADIFGNMHLRIAMQLAQADVTTLSDFGLKGRRMISATCDRVGRLVMNERAGDDEANIGGKAAMLEAHRRDEIVRALAHKAVMSSHGSFRAPTVVFHGETQPEFVENPHVRELLLAGSWPDSYRMEALARGAADRGGLGVVDWLAAERPIPFFLGQEFNVRGHTTLVLRRRPSENMLVIGEAHETRVALLAAAIASAALVEPPGSLRIWVNDRSVDRTPWSDALSVTGRALSSIGYDVQVGRHSHELDPFLQDAHGEIYRRSQLYEADLLDEPTILLVLNQPDRVGGLQRVSDEFGPLETPLGARLRQVLAAGPSVGVHVIVGATSLGVLRSVLTDRTVHQNVRHRVVLQMSEDDSFVLVRSGGASRLQSDGQRPIAALAFDSHRQFATRFKPYTVASGDDLASGPGLAPPCSALIDQLAAVVRQLAGRLD